MGQRALSLKELPWEGPWKGARLISLGRGWGDTSYLISRCVCGTGKAHVILFHRVFVAVRASCGHLCGLHVWAMGVEIVGKWGEKQWSREVPYTSTVPFGGVEQLPANGDLRLVFSGRTGYLVCGEPLHTPCVLVSVWELSRAARLGTLPAVLPDPDAGDGLSFVPLGNQEEIKCHLPPA